MCQSRVLLANSLSKVYLKVLALLLLVLKSLYISKILWLSLPQQKDQAQFFDNIRQSTRQPEKFFRICFFGNFPQFRKVRIYILFFFYSSAYVRKDLGLLNISSVYPFLNTPAFVYSPRRFYVHCVLIYFAWRVAVILIFILACCSLLVYFCTTPWGVFIRHFKIHYYYYYILESHSDWKDVNCICFIMATAYIVSIADNSLLPYSMFDRWSFILFQSRQFVYRVKQFDQSLSDRILEDFPKAKIWSKKNPPEEKDLQDHDQCIHFMVLLKFQKREAQFYSISFSFYIFTHRLLMCKKFAKEKLS